MSHARAQATLIVLSAGTARRRAGSGELAAELASSVDWPLLALTLKARRLLPQLGPRIVDLVCGRAPTSFRAVVEQELAQTRRQGALLALTADRLITQLREAGVQALTLKGAALAEAIYGDPGRRAAADIDLLVAPGDLARAVKIARRAGYGAPDDHLEPDGLPLLHCAVAHERGQLPPLELHWRVHWYERTFAREMLARAGSDGNGALRATPADELTALLLCYARDGFLDLRLATDLAAWWDTLGAQLQPQALAATMQRYPSLQRALLAAVMVAERVVGLPAASLLGGAPNADARVRLAAALANPEAGGDPSQCNADVGLIDGLLSPRGGGWQFVRRQLLPAREVLDERSRLSRERRVSPLGHGARVLGRYGLTLARLTARSPRSPAKASSRQAHSSPFSAPISTSSIPV